ncbi:50S ribosomal protein L11 methyltransferase [Candidatus Neomarinimicrobiota bacterium]
MKATQRCLRLTGQPDKLEWVMAFLADEMSGARQEDRDGETAILDLYYEPGKQSTIESRLAELRADADLGFSSIAVEQVVIPEADWAVQWHDSFPPLQITESITIIPDWDTTAEADVLVKIHPAMAFGTGHHATTALVIRLMDKLKCTGKSILDLGTGSGILAITALKIGARSVLAVEHDPDCLQNFQENVALNDLSERPVWCVGDATTWSDFDYDLIVANIQRSIILPVLTNFAATDSQAQLIVSGILREEESQLRDHCAALDIVISDTAYDGEWMAAVIVRRSQ